ncbi:relaxin-3 receptor 1 [Chanos chanos]|uniref:Relaxin-3 receptor 1 n=1 Tax=Chanos chanos TaxID=29144 RepID=A0A6J2VF65_CHACN|nr:relaxin-3 receptor 1-like [Chanos chanos]
MQNNSALSLSLGVCGQTLEEGADPTNKTNSETMQNLSLHCWLRLLAKESGTELYGDSSSVAIRAFIALVYLILCALGLVGNLLALYLLHSRHRLKQSSINCFVMSLAITDLQFVLTLPFWAVDTALDFRWPFGKVMCKIISSVTTMNMYASVFFLTAMSVARYCSLASSLRMHSTRTASAEVKWASVGIWVVSVVATLPHAVYSTTVKVSDEELCLVRFSDSGSWDPQLLLGLYQTQKLLLGFLIPLVVISVSYLLLLRVVLRRRVSGIPGSESEICRLRRRSKVTKSVTIVVLSFFLCWLPNQALTLWGILIKFDMVPFTKAFYNAQAYTFPITVCLAHTNSCLNPVLYCLIRQEYRAGLKELVLKATSSLCHIANMAFRRKRVAEAEPPLSLVPLNAGV